MRKALSATVMVIGLALALPAAIITNPASGTVNIGQNIGAQITCVQGVSCNMFWGDGTLTGGVDSDFYTLFKYHVYKKPGTYLMHFRRYVSAAVICPLNEYKTITVLDNRTIQMDPAIPSQGQTVTFTAVNFVTPGNITWNMGDGTTYVNRSGSIAHTFLGKGAFTIRAYDWNGDLNSSPVSLTVTVIAPSRTITYSPQLPYVDQEVLMQAVNFRSGTIDWNFGDGTPLMVYSAAVSHRYPNPGVFTITVVEHGMDMAPVSRTITILPENRSLELSVVEARVDEPVTVSAINFRSRQILWDFGDGTVVSGPPEMTHIYKLPGIYVISARDENGASEKRIQAQVRILGISDQVNLEIAEITLDNGKYYKVVPKNSKNIRAQLRMKMRGTGIVSGYWIVDNQPYEFFNETVFQGEIKTIFTREIPGLPVFDPGMHTVSMQLTRPEGEIAVFPMLRYYVLPYENVIETLSPRDGAVIKEDQVATFSWKNALGGSYYQIAFANSLFPILRDDAGLEWLDCPEGLNFIPDARVWNTILRNQWTYWKVRALDSGKNVLAESPVQEMKVIIPGAEVGIQKITDMDGKNIARGSDFTASGNDQLLIHGHLTYPGDAEYLILRVYANDKLVDQLLFRDVKKDERKLFETSVPNMEKESRVVFEVLKSSSPSVAIGYAELMLRKE